MLLPLPEKAGQGTVHWPGRGQAWVSLVTRGGEKGPSV